MRDVKLRYKVMVALVIYALIASANYNVKPSDYSVYVRDPGSSATNLFFATLFRSGDGVGIVVCNRFIRLK